MDLDHKNWLSILNGNKIRIPKIKTTTNSGLQKLGFWS